MGRPFAAILKITPEAKLEFDFGQSRDDEGAEGESVDFSGQPPLGACPKCGSRVFEHGMNYVCEKSVGPERGCDFRSGKVILQQEVAPEQMRKLLADGRTDLLPGFVSSRTNRKFKAFLVRGADGKVGFEFEPRPERPGRSAPARGGKTDEDGGDAAASAPPAPAKKAAARPAAKRSTAGTAAKKPAAKKPAAKRAAAKKPAG